MCNDHTLLGRTQYMMRNRRREQSYRVIAEATGLSHQWLAEFSINKSADYYVTKVQRLHDYLLKEQAEVVA